MFYVLQRPNTPVSYEEGSTFPKNPTLHLSRHLALSRCPLLHKSLQPVLRTYRVVIYNLRAQDAKQGDMLEIA